MEWFQGTIPQAIQSSKARKAYFVVYVEGADDASKTTTEVLDRPAVSGKLKGAEFVCIKLPKDSEGHKQFAEIYKMVPVPSVFFIALNGRATEVVVGKTDGASLESLLSSAIEKCALELKSEAIGAPASSQPLSAPVSMPNNPSAGAASSVSPQPSSSSLTAESSISVKVEHTKEMDKPPVVTKPKEEATPSLDDRVEKAKQLINQKNEEKQKEDIEKEKAAERERRRVGHEMHKAKLSRQEQEMKEALEERKKNSIQEQAARKRILDQIAQDRADRLERERMRAPVVSPSVASAAAAASAPPASNGHSARIQFRLPSGETKTHVFQADTTITQIRQFIDNNIVLPFSEYQLATTFPRREFTWRDNEQSLSTLQLLPSAVLLILPVSGSVVSRPNGWANAMITLFWSVVTPFLSLGNYITSFITGGGNQRPTSGSGRSEPAQQPSAPPPSSSQSSPQPSYGGRTTIRKRGNIHTLADDSDKPDDNNTWNGNSTQQM